MSLIDTHTHIFLEEFDADRTETVERATAAGVELMLLPNIDSTTIDRLHDTVDRFPDLCRPMMGLHPTSVNENFRDELDRIYPLFACRHYVAVGEIGIDLYWDATFRSQQIEAFETQLRWSFELDLPVAIHSRNAFADVFASVDRIGRNRLRGVFHSFGGTREELLTALTFSNFYLGINGSVTFKNAKFDKYLSIAPLDRIIVETDAPYLTPAPFRGKRNEPARLPLIILKLAEIYGLSPEIVAETTTQNARRLFLEPESFACFKKNA
jgi:TatD DNase family protein